MIKYRKNNVNCFTCWQVTNYEEFENGCPDGGYSEIVFLNYYKVPEGWILCDINHIPLRYFNHLARLKKFIKETYE